MSSPVPLPVEIHRSAERGELRKVVKWVRKGGTVDAPISVGGRSADDRTTTDTLLHAAATNGQLEMVRELLKHGASVDLQTSLGSTALQCAEIIGKTAIGAEIAELIRLHAATPELAAISTAAPPDEPVDSPQSCTAAKSVKSGEVSAVEQEEEKEEQPMRADAALEVLEAAEAAEAARATRADAAMEELLAEEAAGQVKGRARSKHPPWVVRSKKSKEKQKAGRTIAAGDESSEASRPLPPAVPAPLPAAVTKAAASAAERAEAGLRAAIASGELSTLERALAAPARHEVRSCGGVQDSVLAEARAMRDRLLEAQQKAEREAKREAAAEAAKLAAAERAQEAAAREAKLAAAAAPKAHEAAAAAAAATAAVAAAAAAGAVAAKTDASEAAEAPDDYMCPITAETMTDPVSTVDGFTYERKAITEWLQTKDTSPITGTKLESKLLISNMMARSLLRRRSSIKDAAEEVSAASLQPKFSLPLPSLPPCVFPLPRNATERRLRPVAGLQQLQAEALAMYGRAIELCDAQELGDLMRDLAPVLDRLRSERSPGSTPGGELPQPGAADGASAHTAAVTSDADADDAHRAAHAPAAAGPSGSTLSPQAEVFRPYGCVPGEPGCVQGQGYSPLPPAPPGGYSPLPPLSPRPVAGYSPPPPLPPAPAGCVPGAPGCIGGGYAPPPPLPPAPPNGYAPPPLLPPQGWRLDPSAFTIRSDEVKQALTRAAVCLLRR